MVLLAIGIRCLYKYSNELIFIKLIYKLLPSVGELCSTLLQCLCNCRNCHSFWYKYKFYLPHQRINPKLAPPPPMIAQNRSSPMDFWSRILLVASMALSVARPYFVIIDPYAPPVICLPMPKLVHSPTW